MGEVRNKLYAEALPLTTPLASACALGKRMLDSMVRFRLMCRQSFPEGLSDDAEREERQRPGELQCG